MSGELESGASEADKKFVAPGSESKKDGSSENEGDELQTRIEKAWHAETREQMDEMNNHGLM